MKLLSQKLAELSVQTKNAEDRVARAQTEAHDKIEQQRDQVRQEAEAALGTVKQRFEEAKGETRARLEGLRIKVNSDVEQMTKHADEGKRKFEAWQAENYASDKESDAIAAIDYAIAAAKMAELLTLDAISARSRATNKAGQVQPTPTMA